MTETNNSDVITIEEEHNPSAAELDYAISQLEHVCGNVHCMNENAREGYMAVRKMAGKSYINMREQDLGFMRGYWLGIDAALKEVRDLLHDREYMRSELYGNKQEGEK